MAAKELSKFCPVILTDEFRSSKLCSSCKVRQVKHPRLLCTWMKRTLDENKNKIRKRVTEVRKCHRLCYCNCSNNFPENWTSSHKIWNRDYNAAKNILYIGTNKLLGNGLGKFSRRVKNI